jgi:hypothetical protein
VEYLVRGQFVLTMQESVGTDGIVKDGAVYVSGKNIIEVGRYNDLKTQYPTATIIGSPRFWVMPGFVNAHQHGKGVTSFQLGGRDEPLEVTRVKATPQAKIAICLDALYAASRMIEAGVTRGRASAVDTVIVDGEIIYPEKDTAGLISKSLFNQLGTSIKPAVEDAGELEEELLPYTIRYYQAWDDETLIPHHIVNSI